VAVSRSAPRCHLVLPASSQFPARSTLVFRKGMTAKGVVFPGTRVQFPPPPLRNGTEITSQFFFQDPVVSHSRDNKKSGSYFRPIPYSEHASTDASKRQDTSKPSASDQVASPEDVPDFRQEATADGRSRPGRATESATRPRSLDSDLAVVVAAWAELPASVRANILAMVNDAL
jgi:hypothetical protein